MKFSNIFFLDYENMQSFSMDDCESDTKNLILVFMGQQHKEIEPYFKSLLDEHNFTVKLIKSNHYGHNHNDMLIMYYIGKYSPSHPEANLKIISKDKDFDSAIEFLKKSQKIHISKLTKNYVPPGVKKLTYKEGYQCVLQYLLDTGKKNRPRKEKKLKNAIKAIIDSRNGTDVDLIFYNMLKDSIFKIIDNKVIYNI